VYSHFERVAPDVDGMRRALAECVEHERTLILAQLERPPAKR
jgi:hypothetical protein